MFEYSQKEKWDKKKQKHQEQIYNASKKNRLIINMHRKQRKEKLKIQ